MRIRMQYALNKKVLQLILHEPDLFWQNPEKILGDEQATTEEAEQPSTKHEKRMISITFFLMKPEF